MGGFRAEISRGLHAWYGNLGTKSAYLVNLAKYFDRLKAKGVDMTPDQLIKDNLDRVYKSDPTDVEAKRRHLNWRSEYVNVQMVQDDATESKRKIAGLTIKKFYEASDSALFGLFRLALSKSKAPEPGLESDDIRAVLKALPCRCGPRFCWFGREA